MSKNSDNFKFHTNNDPLTEGKFTPSTYISQPLKSTVTTYSETCAANGQVVTLTNGDKGTVLHSVRDKSSRDLYLHIELFRKDGCRTVYVPSSYVQGISEILKMTKSVATEPDSVYKNKSQVIEGTKTKHQKL